MLVAITVGGDIIVLTLFAICLGVARNNCAGLPFDAGGFFVDIILIVVAFIIGFIVGNIIIFCINVKYLIHAVLPIGFIVYLICDYILAVSEEPGSSKYPIGIDALLVCIAAGFVAINTMDHEKGDILLNYLKDYARYIFIPFFTLVGLSINLPVLLKTLGFSIVAVILRGICMQLGTVSGGHFAKLDNYVKFMLWIGLLPQAGVSLGLAAIIGAEFESSWGSDFQSTMIGIIIINQIIGPIGAKYLLKKVNEHNKGEGQLPSIAGMKFMGDFDPMKYPRKETQTEDNYDEDKYEGGMIRFAKSRDINPISDGADDIASQFIDLVVEKPLTMTANTFNKVSKDMMGAVGVKMGNNAPTVDEPVTYNNITDDTHNPMFSGNATVQAVQQVSTEEVDEDGLELVQNRGGREYSEEVQDDVDLEGNQSGRK